MNKDFNTSLRIFVILLSFILVSPLPGVTNPPRIGSWDSFWAKVDGIAPEIYITMKQMDNLMRDMIQTASIAKKEHQEGALKKWIKDKIGEKLIELAQKINPATNTITQLQDYALKGTKGWLDWSFRKSVDQIYRKYEIEVKKTGSIKNALINTENWLREDWTPTLLMYEKQKEVIMDNKTLLFALIIKTHKEYHPEFYKNNVEFSREPEPSPLTLMDALSSYTYMFGWSGGEANDFDDRKASYYKTSLVSIHKGTVTMKYAWKSGILKASVHGNTLEGTYKQTNGSGRFFLRFNEDYSFATGWWYDYRNPKKRAAFMKRIR